MANEFANNVREISGLCDTVSGLNAKLSCAIRETNKALAKINAIEGESAAQNRDICQRLQSAIAKAQSFNAMVERLSTINDQELIATINEELQCQPPNQQPLRDYIRNLEEITRKVQQFYSEFSSACTTAIEQANDAIEIYEKKVTAARNKKRTTLVGGGAATTVAFGVGVGTGIALSVVAGVFTFGAGTIIGLSVTAAGVAAAGIGAGALVATGTVYVASDFAKSETAFRELKDNVASMEKIGTELQQAVQSLHRRLEVIEADIGLVKSSMDTRGSPKYPMSRLNENLGKLDRKPNLDQEPQAIERED